MSWDWSPFLIGFGLAITCWVLGLQVAIPLICEAIDLAGGDD